MTTRSTPQESAATSSGARRSRPSKTILTVTLVALLAAATATGVPVAREALSTPNEEPVITRQLDTTPVTTGDLVATTNVKGTLRYAGDMRVLAGPAGVLTMLPAPGSVIAPGGELYRVNNMPVILLRGDLPAWRTFEIGMTNGADVRQLEENLADLGLFLSEPDEVFTWETAIAVQAWQRTLGMEQTGRLDRSMVHFALNDLRVAQLTASRGAEVIPGADLYRATSTTKVVDLDLRLTDQQLAVVGAPTVVALPDGNETPGVVASVGQPTERTEDPGAAGEATSTSVVPVSVTLDAPEDAANFPQASVTVRFSTVLGADVLTAPVEALVAIDAQSFAVEVLTSTSAGTPERIPVTLGAFSSGRVVVSGPGIEDGTPIVVPSS